MNKNALEGIAYILILIGGLNWGTIGAFRYNFVSEWLGFAPGLVTTIYLLIGISAFYITYDVIQKHSE